MKYPEYIKKGDTIGITAPSDGITGEAKIKRFENAKNNLIKMGYKVIETSNVRNSYKERSGTGKQRAEEFTKLWMNDDVKAIICASGGDFEAETLEYLDFELLKNSKPKWVQGYSDSTNLTFTLATMLDIVTVHSDNFLSYGMEPVAEDLKNSIRLMEGNKIEQSSFEKYQSHIEYTIENPYMGYDSKEIVKWRNLNNEEKIHIKGRMIGGCLDVITNLVGTKFDNVSSYIEKYKNDGIIWFLEVFDMNSSSLFLNLWKLKNAGYFQNCKGIVFGRPCFFSEYMNITYEETVKDVFDNLELPIILDADIGHKPPQMSILCGEVFEIISSKGKGKIF